MTYAIETDIEGMLGMTISATSVPTTTQLAVMLTQADAIINGFLKQTSVTDTYGVCKMIACKLVRKMIHNFFAMRKPELYDMIEIGLTDNDKQQLQRAHTPSELGYSWEMLGD
ncbi:MAG: hypothetical protein ACFFD2_15755 [Promethearchaeota archaeon]